MVGSTFKFSAETTEFNKAVEAMPRKVKQAADKIEKNAKSMSGAFGGLGSLLAGGAIVSGLQNILSKMDDIGDMAKRFGVSAVAIQKVGNAAEMVGTNIDSVARTMNKAGVAANKAAREGGALAEAFARVDIDPAKFAAADLEERVKMVAAAQRAANGDAQKMADLYEVVGVKASNIDFSALAEEMMNVNAASEQTVEILGKANDRLTTMKENAFLVGANLMAGASDFFERVGSAMSGAGFNSINELNDQELEQRAKARLQARGELLPSDSSPSIGGQILNNLVDTAFPGGSVARRLFFGEKGATAGNVSVGLNDAENKRRIDAEKERLRQMEAGKKPAATEDDGETAVKNTAEEAKFKQYILDLELQIKEAQAAGDSQKAESIGRLKDWTEAAIKYEGDLDMATRDVNASLKERLRLKEAEIAKQQESIEAELQYAETMAFGTDEAKSKAEWMKIYNEQMARGATQDQARRAANAGTYKEPKQSATSTGGGSIGPSQAAQATTEERIAAMRGEARGAAASAAAQRFQNAGQFRSAVRAQDRAQRQMKKAMEKARVKDLLKTLYGTSNMGEAYQKYKESEGRLLDLRMSEKDFAEDIKKSAMTPEEEMRAEEEAKKKAGKDGKEGGKSSDPMQTVTDIYQLLTERLPIHVLAA